MQKGGTDDISDATVQVREDERDLLRVLRDGTVSQGDCEHRRLLSSDRRRVKNDGGGHDERGRLKKSNDV